MMRKGIVAASVVCGLIWLTFFPICGVKSEDNRNKYTYGECIKKFDDGPFKNYTPTYKRRAIGTLKHAGLEGNQVKKLPKTEALYHCNAYPSFQLCFTMAKIFQGVCSDLAFPPADCRKYLQSPF